MTHNAAKYEELRQEFLQSAAEYDSFDFKLIVRCSAEEENLLVATEQYDIPCRVMWFYPERECAVFAPRGGDATTPYSRLKQLAASSWVGLPSDLAVAVSGFFPEEDYWSQRHHYQGWLRLLFTDLFVETKFAIQKAIRQLEESERDRKGVEAPSAQETEPVGVRGACINEDMFAVCRGNWGESGELCTVIEPVPGIAMEPFSLSAAVIEMWGLNHDEPTPPDWFAQGRRKRRGRKRTSGHHHRNSEEIFKAALRKHHRYGESRGEFNYEPISSRKIEKLMDRAISDGTANRLMKECFGSVENYRRACLNGTILERLSLIMGDVSKTVDPTVLENALRDDRGGDSPDNPDS